MERPKVGIGVIIQNEQGEILIGKRRGGHAPYYSIPGGHLELGETFEKAAIKEVFEETGLIISDPKVFCVTNNLRTYLSEGKHYISINLFTRHYEGIVTLKEPEKCEHWGWYPIQSIPLPQFDASEFAIDCFVKNRFYIADQY
ncbi:MAG: NUDIX domain-containing protein [Saprospiraceae bacterium]|nr:NUDIX domain-containing protein [Saprospiraceae bacterium]